MSIFQFLFLPSIGLTGTLYTLRTFFMRSPVILIVKFCINQIYSQFKFGIPQASNNPPVGFRPNLSPYKFGIPKGPHIPPPRVNPYYGHRLFQQVGYRPPFNANNYNGHPTQFGYKPHQIFQTNTTFQMTRMTKKKLITLSNIIKRKIFAYEPQTSRMYRVKLW